MTTSNFDLDYQLYVDIALTLKKAQIPNTKELLERIAKRLHITTISDLADSIVDKQEKKRGK